MQPDYLRLGLLLAPIILLQLTLAVYSLIDLSRRSRVKGPKGLWARLLVVSLISFPMGIVISGLYLAWARHEEQPDDLD